MTYRYLLEEKANLNLDISDLMGWNNSDMCILNILCYHIEDQHKYPFLQFMMEKIPYCGNIIKEQLILPYVFFKDSTVDIKTSVLDKIKHSLQILSCDHTKITDEMYKGIIFGEEGQPAYALVNITGIDIYGLKLLRQTSSWFVLPSEIINTKKVCNISIDEDVSNLFTDIPMFSQLLNADTNEMYILPDAVYSGGEIKTVEWMSVFGNRKTKIYKNCGEYFYFYRSFGEAIKDGGWKKDHMSDRIGERIICETGGKYINGGINRYALFFEGKIYLENKKECELTDEIIETLYPEPTIIICYTGEKEINPDVLVKNYENFVCLSYHLIDKRLLKDQYSDENMQEYMIA